MARTRNQTRWQLVTGYFARNRRRGTRVDRATLTLGVWRVARVLVPVLVVLVSWPTVRTRVCAHPYFALREVVVQRRGHATEETILRHAGLRLGTTIWDVDAATIEARLLELPWIRTARVRRELPNRVVIRIREYRPLAIVRIDDAERSLFYLAADGRIFAPVDRRDGRDLPYVSGLARADLEAGSGRGPQAIREALLALAAAAVHASTFGPISEVHVDAERGVTMVPTTPAVPVHLGHGAFDAKLARAAEILPRWVDRQDDVRSVSCEFEDQVIVRLRRVGGVGA
jgi:cell division protein FtsQ